SGSAFHRRHPSVDYIPSMSRPVSRLHTGTMSGHLKSWVNMTQHTQHEKGRSRPGHKRNKCSIINNLWQQKRPQLGIFSPNDQDVAGLPRGRNRRSRAEDTHDRGPGQSARYPARLTYLTNAGESIHAPVRAGMEDARAGAKPRLSHRDLRRRPRDPVPEGQSRRGLAATARDHGKAEAHGQRREDTNLQGAG